MLTPSTLEASEVSREREKVSNSIEFLVVGTGLSSKRN